MSLLGTATAVLWRCGDNHTVLDRFDEGHQPMHFEQLLACLPLALKIHTVCLQSHCIAHVVASLLGKSKLYRTKNNGDGHGIQHRCHH